jgi:hypothetical protein
VILDLETVSCNMFRAFLRSYNVLDHGFSNYSACTTIGMLSTFYRYAALIQNRNIKKNKNFKK